MTRPQPDPHRGRTRSGRRHRCFTRIPWALWTRLTVCGLGALTALGVLGGCGDTTTTPEQQPSTPVSTADGGSGPVAGTTADNGTASGPEAATRDGVTEPAAASPGSTMVSTGSAPSTAAPAPPAASGNPARLPLPPGPGPLFEIVDPSVSGISHRNLSGPLPAVGKRYLRDTIGQGIAVLDANGDGFLDLYFPQGTDGTADGGASANLLYLNPGPALLGNSPGGTGQQPDVAAAARWIERGAAFGVDDKSYSFGALAFDYDNDGDEDLLVTNLGPNRLLRNDGNVFTDVTAAHPGLAGSADPGQTLEWSSGAAAGDVDGDGDLDLYVANYVEQDFAALDKKHLCAFMGCRVPCGPNGLAPQPDHFFLNGGPPDYRFVEATASSGFADVETSYGFQPTFLDLDDDGDLDLYVTNDSVFNFLFINEGRSSGDAGDSAAHFSETALLAGAACGRMGQLEAGMGLASGHPEDQRLPDLYVTNFSSQDNSYYSNHTEASDEPWFDETAELIGCGRPTWFRLAWGTSFGDFDNDGHLDLFAANGHIYHQVTDCAPDRIVYEQPNDLFRGTTGGFLDWAGKAGPAFSAAAAHRGAVTFDIEGDGDLDLIINRLDDVPLVARNASPDQGHWLTLDVRRRDGPTAAPRRALGARVTVRAGGVEFTRDLIAGSSFLCSESPLLHFGLGSADNVSSLSVRLPGHGAVSLDLDRGQLPLDSLQQVVLEADGSITLSVRGH